MKNKDYFKCKKHRHSWQHNNMDNCVELAGKEYDEILEVHKKFVSKWNEFESDPYSPNNIHPQGYVPGGIYSRSSTCPVFYIFDTDMKDFVVEIIVRKNTKMFKEGWSFMRVDLADKNVLGIYLHSDSKNPTAFDQWLTYQKVAW